MIVMWCWWCELNWCFSWVVVCHLASFDFLVSPCVDCSLCWTFLFRCFFIILSNWWFCLYLCFDLCVNMCKYEKPFKNKGHNQSVHHLHIFISLCCWSFDFWVLCNIDMHTKFQAPDISQSNTAGRKIVYYEKLSSSFVGKKNTKYISLLSSYRSKFVCIFFFHIF